MNKKDLIKILSSFVSESKAQKITSIAKKRCHSVQILLENITDRGNENAITRTMDGMGIHTLHRLHNKHNHIMKYINPTRTDKGSKKWINTHDWSNTLECVEYIKTRDYLLAGTDCTGNVCLNDINLKGKKIVFGFGNEADGMSKELLDLCDVTFKLPMRGFVTSYNVTVSVAMTLYHMQLLHMDNLQSKTNEEEEDTIIDLYLSLLGAPAKELINKYSLTTPINIKTLN